MFRVCPKCTKLQLKEFGNKIITDMQFSQFFIRPLIILIQKFKFSHERYRSVKRAMRRSGAAEGSKMEDSVLICMNIPNMKMVLNLKRGMKLPEFSVFRRMTSMDFYVTSSPSSARHEWRDSVSETWYTLSKMKPKVTCEVPNRPGWEATWFEQRAWF